MYRLALALGLDWATFLKQPFWMLTQQAYYQAESRMLARLESIENVYHGRQMARTDKPGEYLGSLQEEFMKTVTPQLPLPAEEQLQQMKAHNKRIFETLKRNG